MKTLASPGTRLPELEELKALQLGNDTLVHLLYVKDYIVPSYDKFLEDSETNVVEYDGLRRITSGITVRKHLKWAFRSSITDIFKDEFVASRRSLIHELDDRDIQLSSV